MYNEYQFAYRYARKQFHTVVLDDSRNGRLREPDRGSEHVQVTIE